MVDTKFKVDTKLTKQQRATGIIRKKQKIGSRIDN